MSGASAAGGEAARGSAAAPLVLIEPRVGKGRGHYDELADAVLVGFAEHTRSAVMVGGLAEPPTGWSATSLGMDLAWIRHGAPGARSEREACGLAGTAGHALILTARAAHALALARPGLPRELLERTSLLFHWPPRSAFERCLHRVAARARRHCLALATTDAVLDSLRAVGWRRVRRIAYPVIAPPTPQATSFRHVLMAGSLRFNKGLADLAALIERWSARGEATPILLQSSTKHPSRHGRREGPLLRRIEAAGYPLLREHEGTLDRAAYRGNFRGAITLAAYDPRTFGGQVSGVALDAILSGSPIVASEDTEPAKLVREFGCGVVVRFGDVASLDEAVRSSRDDWESLSARARTAAATLASRHHPGSFVADAFGPA